MPDMDGRTLAARIKAEPRVANVPLVLLSSVGSVRGEVAAMGFDAALMKPVCQATLLETVSHVLGARNERAARAGRKPRAEGPARLRVLLAEDNAVNRTVRVTMLEKLGCQTDAVESGARAVEVAMTGDYDLVLMDVQMPGMDGFAATGEIRRCEAGTACRVPIVAVTAHAMPAHRERCLTAGMDDFLAKPVTLDALATTLRRWHGLGSGSDEQTDVAADPH